MATEKISNNGHDALASICAFADTTISVGTASSFPSSGNFRIIVDSEIMLVTAVSGTTFTVTRGMEGTSRVAHVGGSTVRMIMTAAGLIQLLADGLQVGTDAALPAAERNGRVYFAYDTQKLYFDNGSAWTGYATTGSSGPVDPAACDGRLTLTSGVPVTISDVTGAATIYFTPFKGNTISLYNGSAWVSVTFTETSIPLGTLGSAVLPYDLFAYNNAGTLAFDAPLVWTSQSARATALTTQNGVLVKNGDATRRYIGTFYPTSTTHTEDSVLKRFLWNYYNRAQRPLQVNDATASWTYGTAAWRQADASSANQVQGVIGWCDSLVDIQALHTCYAGSGSCATAVGEDSTTTPDTNQTWGLANPFTTTIAELQSRFLKYSAVGYHYWAWLELSGGVSTTFYGTDIAGGSYQLCLNGLSGFIQG